MRWASVHTKGWHFWSEQSIEDSAGIAEWRVALQSKFVDSQPVGFIDYPIVAAARCSPVSCSSSRKFFHPSLRSCSFYTDAAPKPLHMDELLTEWHRSFGLPAGSVYSLTCTVWGPLAEAMVRGKWEDHDAEISDRPATALTDHKALEHCMLQRPAQTGSSTGVRLMQAWRSMHVHRGAS